MSVQPRLRNQPTKQPHIAIVPRYGNDFSIEVRHDDEGNWETYFNGSCLTLAAQMLNLALRDNPTYNIQLVGWDGVTAPLNGYIFRIRTETRDRRFFQDVQNPFENRKIHQARNPEASVSFTMLGTMLGA